MMASFLPSEGPTFDICDHAHWPDRMSLLEQSLPMSPKALMIAGPLTEADLTELLNTLRKISKHPAKAASKRRAICRNGEDFTRQRCTGSPAPASSRAAAR